MKRKKLFVVIALVLVMAFASFAICGCGGTTGSTSDNSSENDDANTSKVKPAIFSVGAACYPEAGGMFGMNMYLNALIGLAERHPDVKGKFSIEIADKGMLYNQEEVQTALSSGAVQMAYTGPHFLEQWDPAWKCIETPGVIDDWAHFMRVMETEPWKALTEKLEKENNITILKWMFNTGNWYLFTSKGPAKTLEDLKGQKIRYAGGEAFSRAIEAMGMNGVSLPYTEVVSALQTNMIDGVVTDFVGVPYFNLDRYCQYVNAIPWAIQPYGWAVNTTWWESLDPKVRQAIFETFQRIDMSYYYDNILEPSLMQEWRDNPDLNLIEYDEAEAKRWREAMRPAIESVLAGVDPKYLEAIDSVRDK